MAEEYQKRELVKALPTGTNTLGSVKVTDGTETASVNDQNILDTSSEHSLKGKTILYNSGNALNSTTVLRTVTAGKTYYMIAANLSWTTAAANIDGSIYVGATGNIIVQGITSFKTDQQVGGGNQINIVFPHPIPVVAGVEIKVRSAGATERFFGSIIGWEE